jgi:hypothetical protein
MGKCRIAFYLYNSAALSPFPEKMQSTIKMIQIKKCCGNTTKHNFSVKMFMILSFTTIP